jgi:hypothetical protein
MSIRAYKLIEIKTEKNPSFNFSNDYFFINKYILESENQDIIQIEKESLKQIKKDIEDKELLKNAEIDKETATELYNNIKEDIGDDDYVEYYCY